MLSIQDAIEQSNIDRDVNDFPARYGLVFPSSLFDIGILEHVRAKAAGDIAILQQLNIAGVEDMVTRQKIIEGIKDATVNELKKLESLINIYHIYSRNNDPDALIINDSFGTKDKISDTTNAGIDTQEGILTLAESSRKQIDLSNARVLLSPNIKGDTIDDTDIRNVIDNSLDSYYAMELKSTVLSSDNEARLEFLIELPNPTPVNHIEIKGLNLGAVANPKIASIEISHDGINFNPINNWFGDSQPEDKPWYRDLTLSPDANITFLPYYAKAIKLVFSQKTPIYDPEQDAYLYRVGISEVKLYAITYSASSRFESIQFPISNLPRLIALDTVTNLSNDGDFIDYAIKLGDKEYPITPLKDAGSNEIMAINQPWLKGSIEVNENVNFFQLVARLHKDKDKFPDIVSQQNTVQVTSEYVNIPTTEPYRFSLSNSPIPGTLDIIMYPYASVGKDVQIKIGQVQKGTYSYSLQLPFQLSNNVIISAGPYKLRKYDSLSDLTDFAAAGYYIDQTKNTIKVVIRGGLEQHDPHHPGHIASTNHKTHVYDDTNIGSAILNNQYDIMLYLEPEILYPDQNLKLHLNYMSDAIPENFGIKRVVFNQDGTPYYETIVQYIPKGARELHLTHVPKPGTELVVPDSYQVEYIDGVSEFVDNHGFAFSVDYENKMLYRNNPAPVDMSVTFTADYIQPVEDSSFVVIDPKTIMLSPYVATAPSGKKIAFAVSYNIAASLPKDSYVIKDSVVTLTDKTILDIFLNKISYGDKLIRATYKYRDDNGIDKNTFVRMFTPIIEEYTIKVLP